MMYKPPAIITNNTIPPRMILTVSDININPPKLDRATNPKIFSTVFPDLLPINTRNARAISPKPRKYLTMSTTKGPSGVSEVAEPIAANEPIQPSVNKNANIINLSNMLQSILAYKML